MNGFQFRDEQLQDLRLSAIPVICMTADAKVAGKLDRLRLSGCLIKPLEPSDLLAAVRTAFHPTYISPSL